MGRQTYLWRRNEVYYARMDVPTGLVTVVGKTTLKTSGEATAKRLLWPAIQQWQREFEDLRLQRAQDQSDMEHAVWQHCTDSVERDEGRRQTPPTQRDIDDATERAVHHIQCEGIDINDPRALSDAGLGVQVLQNRVQSARMALEGAAALSAPDEAGRGAVRIALSLGYQHAACKARAVRVVQGRTR